MLREEGTDEQRPFLHEGIVFLLRLELLRVEIILPKSRLTEQSDETILRQNIILEQENSSLLILGIRVTGLYLDDLAVA